MRGFLCMKKKYTDLFALIHRFPDREEALNRLFFRSTNFQEICEDYRKCQDALLYLARSDNDNTSASWKEYALLLKELESEIIQYLNRNT